MIKGILLVLVLLVLTGVGVWAFSGFKSAHHQQPIPAAVNQTSEASNLQADATSWEEAVAKAKEDRSTDPKTAGALVVPPELRHYDDRHWFLATQVAEVVKHNLRTCQDFVDLAAMLQRGEFVPLPAVTETYVLLGVGAKADEGAFTKFVGDQSIEPYNEAEINEAYKRLNEKKTTLQSNIAELNRELEAVTPHDADKRAELEKTVAVVEQELKSTDEDRRSLEPNNRQNLLRDYESLQELAKNFNGRSFNLDDAADRQALKVNMLSSLRPPALKILEQIASSYHRQFNRPLPISSLTRPEQYQHTLRRFNRYAVLIDTPPHSTGLAFDIDYRYMGAGEQTFVMAELARMKQEGRIEVIRERGANFHVFAFINSTRPNDDLIAASLDKAVAPPKEITHHSPAAPKRKAR